jgi:hypothetical protein
MIVGTLFALFGAMVLVLATRLAGEAGRQGPISSIIMGGYVLRLVLQTFQRDFNPFKSEGFDCVAYEAMARKIAVLWRYTGIHLVTSAEWPGMGPTSLPPNMFAFVIFLNDDDFTRLGCVALVALAAGLAVLNLYLLAMQFGADRNQAVLMATLTYFDLAFLYYTSDTYKDGLVLFFAVGALASAIRLTYHWSLRHAVAGAACLWALWYCRYYLVFITVAPLVVGLAGVRSKSILRPAFVALGLFAVGMALVTYSGALQTTSAHMEEAFTSATSGAAIQAKASGGSGVTFDDGGSPTGAIVPKLLYTLFSPFFWSGGSTGLQIGKVEALLWYFIAYRAYGAAKKIDRTLLLMLLTFLVPCTLAYAMTMSNVGLIVRQRLVIVAATAFLAALYKRERRAVPERLQNVLYGAARRQREGTSLHPRGVPTPTR